MVDTVQFRHMADGSREDYLLLGRLEQAFTAGTADRVLATLETLRGSYGGYKVDRLNHSVQTATRAARDGADDETIVAALLHDIGDNLAPLNHGEFAAAVLKPFVGERTWWVVRHHGLFQGYYYFHHLGGDRDARDRFAGHPHYDACVEFCERYDQCSFDPDYESMALSEFEPMVRSVFARKPFSLGLAET